MAKIPTHLRTTTKKWYKQIIQEYELESHHLSILTMVAEVWDRIQEAKEVIEKEGAYYEDRFGQPKAHPALAEERNNRVVFARLIRELALDIEQPRETGRPPRLY